MKKLHKKLETSKKYIVGFLVGAIFFSTASFAGSGSMGSLFYFIGSTGGSENGISVSDTYRLDGANIKDGTITSYEVLDNSLTEDDISDSYVAKDSSALSGAALELTLTSDDTKIPSSKAVMDYVDSNTDSLSGATLETILTSDDGKIPTSKAVMDYIDSISLTGTVTSTGIVSISTGSITSAEIATDTITEINISDDFVARNSSALSGATLEHILSGSGNTIPTSKAIKDYIDDYYYVYSGYVSGEQSPKCAPDISDNFDLSTSTLQIKVTNQSDQIDGYECYDYREFTFSSRFFSRTIKTSRKYVVNKMVANSNLLDGKDTVTSLGIDHSTIPTSKAVKTYVDLRTTPREGTCSGLPSNAIWNTDDTFLQTFDGSTWGPASKSAEYNINPSSGDCRFKCATDYTWDGSRCKYDGLVTVDQGQWCYYSYCLNGYYELLSAGGTNPGEIFGKGISGIYYANVSSLFVVALEGNLSKDIFTSIEVQGGTTLTSSSATHTYNSTYNMTTWTWSASPSGWDGSGSRTVNFNR